jgi:hypothetical protein
VGGRTGAFRDAEFHEFGRVDQAQRGHVDLVIIEYCDVGEVGVILIIVTPLCKCYL